MKKIEKKLEDAIRKNLEQSFSVLIVVKENSDTDQLNLDNSNKMMGNILSTQLKGSKILSIAENDSVESIELDGEVSITN